MSHLLYDDRDQDIMTRSILANIARKPGEFPTGRQFFESAREILGYEKNLLYHEGRPYIFRETTGEYMMEVRHDCRCDELSRRIAMECYQAKNIPPEGISR